MVLNAIHAISSYVYVLHFYKIKICHFVLFWSNNSIGSNTKKINDIECKTNKMAEFICAKNICILTMWTTGARKFAHQISEFRQHQDRA